MINNFKKSLVFLVIIILLSQANLTLAVFDNINVGQSVTSEAICNINRICEEWRNEDSNNCPTDCPSSGVVTPPPPPPPPPPPAEVIEAPKIIEPIAEPEKPAEPTIVEKALEVLKPIISKFIELAPTEVTSIEVPAEGLPPEEKFSIFENELEVISPEILIEEPNLEVLVKEIEIFVEKFPGLEVVFKDLGISQVADIEKLKTVELVLPGLAERTGQSMPTPIAEMTQEEKQQLPAEVIFARTGDESIDFNSTLSVNEKGELQQKISSVSGKSLQLVIKADKPTNSIKGYVVFKSKSSSPTSYNKKDNFISQFGSSLIFANPVFAKDQDDQIGVEENQEFEYTDPDKDGIYTANINAPTIEGEYEITTVMNYKDPKLGNRQIKLITVVDPEGYVYEKKNKREIRVSGATVSIYWLNPKTNQYELWSAKQYNQENPQITNIKGTYAFLVPKGFYFLKVDSPEYIPYKGEPFQVKAGSGVHINIALKAKFQWSKIDIRDIILFIVVILLIFLVVYRHKRKRLLNRKF